MQVPLTRATRYVMRDRQFRQLYRKYREYTMIDEGLYCGNLHLARNVASVEGCIVECGTWRGGMIAGIADVLGSDRSYYLCDSYQGLPPVEEIDGADALAWQNNTTSPNYHNNCSASEEDARSAMAMSAAKDVKFIKGWFENTLPSFPSVPIALLRMDADWYSSTKCILENLTNRLVPGGLIIVDDYYYWEGCAVAVNEFAAHMKWRIRQHFTGVCYITV